ncbi:PQQ-dependent sugar dehydrogenase [Hymenobacter psychrotolerans]|uniref:Dehydrogenase, PQQ-dependent, s-GDH family n=1 Tax=Hymenobacter psychrotolerans DSM 18569 TaxID=1121959 RepID=A0A1M7HLH7_9BACT|nr:PQQ-dependent sugar dehydrogenase [Hymenobacter psychrotolerans]SHM29289.1 dehydrogenase, PQQ-dependent, s-GDH family [Hymenobacter psychrotolerans DSM 18569]
MKRIATLLLLAGLAAPAGAQQNPALATYSVGTTTLTLSALSTGLDTPWEILWGPDGFLWMTERGGRISRVNATTGQVLPLLTVADVTETGESGLLGMALHPDFSANPYVYVVYNYTEGGALKEKLVRFTYSATAGTLASPLTLLGNLPATTTHSGSRLLILPDQTLLMTTGDAQLQPEAQNIGSLNGKILRLNLDGTIPANNPTPGSAVYTLGHRNPQGLVRALSGRLYSSEHGPNNDDEVNLIEPGRNYGWPNVEGFCNLPAEQTFCSANNVREPLVAYTPTLAVAGIAAYQNPAIPQWSNSLLMVSLKAGALTHLQLNTAGDQVTSQSNIWAGTYGRLRAICVSPQGRIYIGTSNRDGRTTPGPTDDRILVLENRAYTPNSVRNGRANALVVWPNPASGSFSIKLPEPATSPLEVRDALGRTVQTVALTGRREGNVDIRQLQAGLYTVHTQLSGTRFTQRLLVQ